MHDGTTLRALEFLFKTVVTFLLLEILVFPLRPIITKTVQIVLYAFLPNNFEVSWECTALDEVFLLSAALWWSGGSRKIKMKRVFIGALIIEIYNLIRIAILAYYPNELLHDILFRWGGFLTILGAYYILVRQRI